MITIVSTFGYLTKKQKTHCSVMHKFLPQHKTDVFCRHKTDVFCRQVKVAFDKFEILSKGRCLICHYYSSEPRVRAIFERTATDRKGTETEEDADSSLTNEKNH